MMKLWANSGAQDVIQNHHIRLTGCDTVLPPESFEPVIDVKRDPFGTKSVLMPYLFAGEDSMPEDGIPGMCCFIGCIEPEEGNSFFDSSSGERVFILILRFTAPDCKYPLDSSASGLSLEEACDAAAFIKASRPNISFGMLWLTTTIRTTLWHRSRRIPQLFLEAYFSKYFFDHIQLWHALMQQLARNFRAIFAY